MKDNIAIIIPAYNPDKELEKIVQDLQEFEYTNIVVVNDGSKSKDIFNNITNKVIVLQHEKNKGKGRALKTGIEYCQKNMKNIIGVITIDADGQHIIKDINNVYKTFEKKSESLILGVRNFKNKNVPFKSKIGNKLATFILQLKTKQKIKDTQTGLRAIPSKYLKVLYEKVEGERFEYEINSLLYFIKNKVNIEEVTIDTIYFDHNKGTKYKPIKDSIKIYNIIKKFSK